MGNQTTVQHPETIRFGSGKIELMDSAGAWVDLGAMNGISFEYTYSVQRVEADNVGVILEKIAEEQATISGDMLEINLDTLGTYLEGVSLLSTTPGGTKSVSDEELQIQFLGYAYRLQNRNADGTLVTGIVVKKGATALALGTDYGVVKDSGGFTNIYAVEGGKVAAGDKLTVSYSYVSDGMKKLSVGGTHKIKSHQVRLTNYNSYDEPFIIHIYKATADEGVSITFNADNADSANSIPIKFVGSTDTKRKKGDQLLAIEDHQFSR